MEAGEVELDSRAKLLAEYMTIGTDHARARRLGIPLNTPLSIEQAADVLDIRRRHARTISRSPKFQALAAELLGAVRSGAKGIALAKVVELVGRKVETAADGKLALDAATTLLEDGPKGGVGVTINNVIHQNNLVRAGYVFERSLSSQPERPATIVRSFVERKLDFGPYGPPAETLEQNRARLTVAPPVHPAIGEEERRAGPSAFEELRRWK
jgi:hypothetical protein